MHVHTPSGVSHQLFTGHEDNQCARSDASLYDSCRTSKAAAVMTALDYYNMML